MGVLQIKQSWWQLLSIQVCGTLCIPVLMISHLIYEQHGWLSALAGIGIGNTFLLILGYLYACLSTTRSMSTVEYAAFYFGSRGRLLFGTILIMSMLGWFGVQLNIVSHSIMQSFNLMSEESYFYIFNLGIGFAISLMMSFGINAMKYISYVCAPLLAFTLVYMVYFNENVPSDSATASFTWVGGASLVIGVNIAAIVDLPTFFMHSKTKWDARICVILLYGFITPVIEIVGCYLAASTEGNSYVEVFKKGHGQLWMLWICCFTVASGWSSNSANLYSAIVSSYSLIESWGSFIRSAALGAAGTLLACLDPLGNIEKFLEMLGIAVGAMGAVVASNYLLEKWCLDFKIIPVLSLLCWVIGVCAGAFSSLCYLSITGVSSIDAFVVSVMIHFALYNFISRNLAYETVNV